MSDILITITQALQLVALVPSIFVVVFLLCMFKRDGSNVVPILYFLALACQFVIPLLPVLYLEEADWWIHGGLVAGAGLVPAFSFLLIVQFLRGGIPPLIYWAVLAIPLIGGTPFIYAALQSQEVCLDNSYCIVTDNLRVLYDVASNCLIFMLVVIYVARGNARITKEDTDRKHKYWLMIALVILNLVVIAIDLLHLNDNLAEADTLLIATVIRIGFIYLVLTSIFRLFYDVFEVQMADASGKTQAIRNPEHDKQVVDQLNDLLEYQKAYREMGLNRKKMAEQLSVSEHQLSRIINSYFKKNFNELINQYRVNEAKERLLTEPEVQITTIAYEVGFNSIASFNRVFKELTESSPSAYRSFERVK